MLPKAKKEEVVLIESILEGKGKIKVKKEEATDYLYQIYNMLWL